MTTGRVRTIWLSDTHLGTRGCRARDLLDFLDSHECEYLYLVGDIIDFWRLKRSPYWAQLHSDVIRAVLSKARAGTTVTFVPGNHDEYLRRFCDLQLGNIMITREAIHRTVDGRLLLVVHGDEFDGITRCHRWLALTGDVGYEALLVLNRWFNGARRLLGLPYWSLSAYVKGKVIGSLVRLPQPVRSFHAEVMRRKEHDHHASHSDTVNQLFHVVSSSAFLVCYGLVFWDLTTAMWASLGALFLRQIGHAVLEPPCHDKEATLLGYNTRNKTLILGAYLLIPVVHLFRAETWSGAALRAIAPAVAEQWLLWTALVVGGRVAYLLWTHGARLALVWFVKLITDPITDLGAYAPRFLAMLGIASRKPGAPAA